MIRIRKAHDTDLDAVAELYDAVCDGLASHTNYPGWQKGIYPVRENAENGLKEAGLYVAEMDGALAGTMILLHQPEAGYEKGNWETESDYARICVVHTLAVHPEFLRAGVGRAMLAFADRAAAEERCLSIRLDVVKGNIPAENLYRKCGYRYCGTVSLGYEAYGLPWFNLYEKKLQPR